MKPCSGNRKSLAWLALGTLDARHAERLHAHLQTCEGCRRYLAELSTVKERLAAADTPPDIQASEAFHRRLTARLQAKRSRSVWESLAVQLAEARWIRRTALPVTAAAAMVILGLSLLVRPPATSTSSSADTHAVQPRRPGISLAPTIANYQRAAARSLDDFDDFLTRQADHRQPAATPYPVSMLAIARGLD